MGHSGPHGSCVTVLKLAAKIHYESKTASWRKVFALYDFNAMQTTQINGL